MRLVRQGTEENDDQLSYEPHSATASLAKFSACPVRDDTVIQLVKDGTAAGRPRMTCTRPPPSR